MNQVLDQTRVVVADTKTRSMRILLPSILAFAVACALWAAYMKIHPASWTLYPVDLRVYRDGGLIARHVRPTYNAALRDPLYDWSDGPTLRFTYPPFAATVFAVVSCLPWPLLPRLSQVVNVAALTAAAWCTMTGLGYRDRRVRASGALLGTAVGLATEPVFRTMYLGQTSMILMAAVLWDLTRPRDRWWAGAAIGLAAGIKLVPLIFVPYLLLTCRFRQAALACAVFACTAVTGFVVLPPSSAAWWLRGLFISDGRAGFVGWGGNQSLDGLATRLAGSLNAATWWWLAAALIVAVTGLSAATALRRAGYLMPGILLTALTGLLVSPVSWDHHWVWAVPAMMTAAGYALHYATRARQARQARGLATASLASAPGHAVPSALRLSTRALGCAAAALAMLAVFFPWPGSLWGTRNHGPGTFTNGLLWAAPSSPVDFCARHADQHCVREYHWRGLQLLAGNAYVLLGLAMFVILVTAALRARPPGPKQPSRVPGMRQPFPVPGMRQPSREPGIPQASPHAGSSPRAAVRISSPASDERSSYPRRLTTASAAAPAPLPSPRHGRRCVPRGRHART